MATAVIITFILGACGASDRPGIVARDSAGIRIVENELDPARTAPLTVEMEPEVQIGAVDGPEEQTFRSVAGAMRLADGRILVADVDRVLVYDASGAHLFTFGRKGEGPGEFDRIAKVVACGSEVVVGEFIRALLSVFDATDGHFLRTDPLPPSGTFFPLQLQACLGDGTKLLRSPNASVAGMANERVITLVRLGSDASLDTIGHVRTLRMSDGLPAPFGSTTLFDYGDTLVHVVESSIPEVQQYGLDGSLRQIARLGLVPRPVTEEDGAREREARIEAFPAAARELAARDMDQLEAAPTMPIFSRMVVDPAGRTWLKRYRPSWEPEDSVWLVVDADGAVAGHVPLPSRFTVHEIGDDYVLGVWRDELDVSYVRMHRLERR